MTNNADNTNKKEANNRLWYGLEPKDWIAVIALVVAVFSIGLGTYQTDRNIHASIKPLLDVSFLQTADELSMNLLNYGLGPAIMTDIQYYNGSRNSSDLRNLIKLPYDADFDRFRFAETSSYIRNDQELVIASLSKDGLRAQNFNDTQIREIMHAWLAYWSTKAKIKIDYEDALGEKQKTVARYFSTIQVN
jgi:hypothetical protein